ncbi:MAG: toll/interleukin-1 receptor domain-containing protein [Roseiarcus sp.]
MPMTPFELTLQSELDVERQRFANQWLFPWHGMTYQGGVTDVDDFRGGRIHCSGFKFGAQQQQIFWQAIGRYLNQKVHETFKRWDEATRGYPSKLRNSSLDGTSDCLHRFAATIIRHATDTDRRLRGQGFPNKVDPFDATRYHSGADAEIERLKTGHLALMPEERSPEKVARESTSPPKPIIFISYAHADEPEQPAEGEVKWLSFVTGYLRPAVKHGAVEIWIDRLMRGGDNVDPEIERKLRACDIFVLLVSPHSLSSDYIIDKEIAIIRERQANCEDVHFYPLLLTPTPNIALDIVRDKNLRPRDGKSLFEYSVNDRYRHMSDAADEIAEIAGEIAARKDVPPPLAPSPSLLPTSPALVLSSPRVATDAEPPLAPLPAPTAPSLHRSPVSAQSEPEPQPSPSRRAGRRRTPKPMINDRESLELWLWRQSRRVAVVIGVRAALRVLPQAVLPLRQPRSAKNLSEFLTLTAAIFRATALTRVAGKYPSRAKELDNFAANRAAAAAFAAARAAAEADVRAADAEAFASSANAAGAAFAAVRSARASGADTDAVQDAASAVFASARAATHDIWDVIHADIGEVRKVNAAVLMDLPLWLPDVPDWTREAWAILRSNLPRDQDWDVWIDWYEDRLRGGSRGECYEFVFASVPRDVWDNSPAAANAWIKEHLPLSPAATR